VEIRAAYQEHVALACDWALPPWPQAVRAPIARSWRGDAAAADLHTTARVSWTQEHLCVGFECAFTELDIDTEVDVTTERCGLWERDVCEAFVRSPHEPRADSYKEFEVAPTGQWCDLAIHRPRVDVDWTWRSGMQTAAEIDVPGRLWRALMRIPFSAFGTAAPRAGDVWHVNLFRISRLRGERHYLAYAPTGTPSPDFHVPERFVPLVFDGPREP
jgi:hypothetical protein